MGPDLARHLEPVLGLGRCPGEKVLPIPDHVFEIVYGPDKGGKGMLFRHSGFPEKISRLS
jgi:hypothetical protein